MTFIHVASFHINGLEGRHTHTYVRTPFAAPFLRHYQSVYRIFGILYTVKFWEIISDEAIGVEKLGKSTGRFPVILLYL